MKIAFICQPEYFRFCYENDLDFLGDVREFNLNFSMDLGDFISLEEFNADINVFFRGEFIPNEVLKKLKGLKVNLSSEVFPKYLEENMVFSLDSLNRYEYFIKGIQDKYFDYVFHYDQTSIKFIAEDNLFLSGEFCFPVATETYKPENIQEQWDFFFIGRSTEHRERFFGPLKHYYNFLHICHGIWGESLVKYMNQSKILLNIHAENEISWEPRVQMLMATGKMVISEKLSCNKYFIPGEDYIEVSSPEEMYQQATYYLENEEQRCKIAKNGQEKVLNYLSSKKVFPQFFQDLKNKKYEKYSCTNFRTNLAQSRLQKLKRKEKFKNLANKTLNWFMIEK